MFEQFKLAEQLEMEKTLAEWKDLKFATEVMEGVMKSRGCTDCTVGNCRPGGSDTRYQCFSLKVEHLPRFKAFFGQKKGNLDADIFRIWPTRGVFEQYQIAVDRPKLIKSFLDHHGMNWEGNIKWSRDFKFSEMTVEEAVNKINADLDNVVGAFEIGDRVWKKVEKMANLEFEKVACYEPTEKKKKQ